MSEKKISRKHCLMLFYKRCEIEENPEDPEEYVNTNNIYIDDGIMALNMYAETPCPASQLVSGETEEELEEEIKKMRKNFKDQDWLKENIEPYI